jgi:hypothetical protein
MSITLKVIKVYGEKVNKVYPKDTRRVITKLSLFPPKIKKVVQTCTVESGKNKWHDIKVKKQKNETE